MGGPPDLGEEQQTTVSISGPDKTASKAEKDAFDADFAAFKQKVKDLRKSYPRLKAKCTKIAYTKKDPNDSYDK